MEVVSRMKSNEELAEELRRQYRQMYKRGSHFRPPGVKRGASSSTAGSKKGENCKASSTKRFMAKYSRSYRDPGYPAWCEKWRGK